MRIIKESSEDEMIIEFLKSEICSRRFCERLINTLKRLGIDKEIITNANLESSHENELRKNIMKEFRGYPGEDIFKNFPNIDKWTFVEFNTEDLEKIYYVDYDYWNELSNGTSKPSVAAKNIKNGIQIRGIANEHYMEGLKILEKGSFPPIVLITCNDSKYVVIEGHSRMTIYGMRPEKFNKTYGFIGYCSSKEMKKYDPRMVMDNELLPE